MAILLRGLALGFGAAATPGPFQAYLLAQSLRNGARFTRSLGFLSGIVLAGFGIVQVGRGIAGA
ncbi:MAG TPA: hypothetical protein VIV57_10870 [Anaeromyxobacter sp.]